MTGNYNSPCLLLLVIFLKVIHYINKKAHMKCSDDVQRTSILPIAVFSQFMLSVVLEKMTKQKQPHTNAHTHTHAHTRTHTHKHIWIHTWIHTGANTYTNKNNNTHERSHTRTHTYKQRRVCVCACECMRVRTRICVCV